MACAAVQCREQSPTGAVRGYRVLVLYSAENNHPLEASPVIVQRVRGWGVLLYSAENNPPSPVFLPLL